MVVSGGLGLAVSSDSVARFVAGLQTPHRRLGVSAREVRLPGRGPASLLVDVEPRSAADRADAIERDNPLRLNLLRGAVSPPRETVVRWKERNPAAA